MLKRTYPFPPVSERTSEADRKGDAERRVVSAPRSEAEGQAEIIIIIPFLFLILIIISFIILIIKDT